MCHRGARTSRNASEAAINCGLVRQTIMAKGRRFLSAPTRSRHRPRLFNRPIQPSRPSWIGYPRRESWISAFAIANYSEPNIGAFEVSYVQILLQKLVERGEEA
jgi:hypothetical protein